MLLCLQTTGFANTIEKTAVEKNDYLPPMEEFNQSKNLTSRQYILGANDIISIEIYNVPQLSGEVRVQPDGKVSIPYLGSFSVAGKSIDAVREIIINKYGEYLINPEITVKLVQSRPFIVYISGAVLNPGSYELSTITNQSAYLAKPEAFIERKTPILSNVIVAAGGITYDADYENVMIKNDYDNLVYKVNLFQIIANANSAQDLYLMAGDRIYVPQLPSPTHIDQEKYKILLSSTIFQRTIPVKVMGYVNKPGLINLNSTQTANLSSALALAGGYQSDTAYTPHKVLVSRLDNNNNLVTIAINPRKDELLLMPNDVIYVPEKIRPSMGKLFDYISRVLSPFYMFSNTYRSWDTTF
ncbi:MAG TPA: polysaccharide biosynthesis/export family protein [Candidatus Gastranaerophilales bacterium]|nr:polysaccharide biosynthesis/export family protein [Candidatus Gastranaerophilales bacterium]